MSNTKKRKQVIKWLVDKKGISYIMAACIVNSWPTKHRNKVYKTWVDYNTKLERDLK